MINDVGLFCAKLVVELITDAQLLEAKLLQMEELLSNAYYLEFYRGRNYFDMGFPESALAHFEAALKKNPEAEDLPYIYSFMGSCLKDLGKYEEAIVTLKIGLSEDEERPDLHNTLGVCYFKQENYEQAIVHFQRAVDLNPASGMDYANLGVNYSKLGKTEQAAEFLTIALTIDPELDFARDLLARL